VNTVRPGRISFFLRCITLLERDVLPFDVAEILQSMRERAVLVGGTFDLLSADGVGTQVRIRIHRATRA